MVFLNKPFDVDDLFDMMADCAGLTWEYMAKEDEEQAESIEPVIPPREALSELRAVAQRGSMKRIRQWCQKMIEQDEQYRHFVEQVETLVKGYDPQGIEALVERYL